VLVLHGAGVDHREPLGTLEPAFAAAPGYRRIYPDLPGHGATPAPASIQSADDVLDALLGLVDDVVGEARMLVVGHSAGAYYARALALRRPDQIAGLALICPLVKSRTARPEESYTYEPAARSATKGKNSPAPLYRIRWRAARARSA